MGEAHPLILTFRRDGLKDLDPSNVDEVHKMWHAFSKAKHSIDGGDRLEYLSWRLYSREMLRRQVDSPKICLEPQARITDKAKIEELEDSDVSSSSDDDWEAADDSHEPIVQQPVLDRAPQSVLGLNSRPSIHAQSSSTTHNPHGLSNPSSQVKNDKSRVKLSKPFSSVELEHLFSDVQENTVPLKHPEEKAKAPCPLTIDHKGGRVLTPQNSDGSAISQFSSNYRAGLPLRNQDPVLDSSSAVRGFSPLAVSISKQPAGQGNKVNDTADLHSRQHSPANEIKTAFSTQRGPEIDFPIQAKKMFYFGSQESDIESSTSGSIEPTDDRKPLQNLNAAENNSDWDDVEETDDDDDALEEEIRRKEMFKERLVPTKPLLKRSLLSSMFVSSMKLANHNIDTEPELPVINDLSSRPQAANIREDSITPANILLEAPLAPHLPFTATSDTEEGSFGRFSRSKVSPIEKIADKAPDILADDYFTSWAQAQSVAHRTHIIARPEMYRASSSLAQQNRKLSDEKSPEDWDNHHDDIYDPLNYHSRGW